MATKILFRANDGTSGYELWVTDGTAAGTYLLDDINPGAGNSTPASITALGNGKAVFAADDGTYGNELWVTDGTAAGTHMVDDIHLGLVGSSPLQITALGNGTALFTADDGVNGRELWITDGTATSLLADINPGSGGSNANVITALGNGKAIFSAYDPTHGIEPWITDGTASGTTLLYDIRPGSGSSNPRYFTALGSGLIVFAAGEANHGRELWVTNGTITAPIDIRAGSVGSYPYDITALGNGKAVFAANNGSSGSELWVTDGTAAGTSQVFDINPGSAGSYVHDLAALGNGKAVFRANDGTYGYELWVTDGTAAGTGAIKDIFPGTSSSSPANMTALGNGKAVFAADDGTNGRELWVTDGTPGGTKLVADLNPGSAGSNPQGFVARGDGTAIFTAIYGTDGYEPVVTDGTAAGTHLVKDIFTGSSSSLAGGFAVLTPVCFCRGTLIRTDRGEVPVEALAVGDTVETLSGALRPVRWIGFGRDLVTAKNPPARPIIVRRGALADNVPKRDLYLTHGHALYIDGVLVPVELLVNHRSILWDDAARVVEYYHIELDSHDVVIAEGAAAESYHDADNRALFQNARRGSKPGAATPTYAPVLNGGAVVKKIWAALAARAGEEAGTGVTDDPDLHLVIDGKRLDPVSNAGGVYTFLLTGPPTGRLLLSSRNCVPSLTGSGQTDHRRLGVAIRQLLLHRPGVITCFDHNALFAIGHCYAPEPGHCWTHGALELPAGLFAHMQGAFTLIAHTQPHHLLYPIAAAAAAA